MLLILVIILIVLYFKYKAIKFFFLYFFRMADQDMENLTLRHRMKREEKSRK